MLPRGFLFGMVVEWRKVCIVFLLFGVMLVLLAGFLFGAVVERRKRLRCFSLWCHALHGCDALRTWIWLWRSGNGKWRLRSAAGAGDGGVFPVVGVFLVVMALWFIGTPRHLTPRSSSCGCGSAVTALSRRISGFGRQASPPSLL